MMRRNHRPHTEKRCQGDAGERNREESGVGAAFSALSDEEESSGRPETGGGNERGDVELGVEDDGAGGVTDSGVSSLDRVRWPLVSSSMAACTSTRRQLMIRKSEMRRSRVSSSWLR